MSQPFKAKKSLGQNFLKNPQIALRIAEAASISAGEVVFEIGPGTGMLTRALLHEGAQVLALEADERAVEVLNATFEKEIREGLLTLIHGDIRNLSLEELPLPKEYKVVANIPYYISGMLFELFLSAKKQPSCLVFLVQQEVAERIARSKKESILSLSVKAYGIPDYIGTVTRGNFTPQPNVDSAILRIREISRDRFLEIDEKSFFLVLKTGFTSRRKQLQGNLASLFGKEAVIAAFTSLNIPEKARGEDLSIETWIALTEALKAHI